MLQRLLRVPRLEFEVGCLVPLALVFSVAIAVGVVVGMRLQPQPRHPGSVTTWRVRWLRCALLSRQQTSSTRRTGLPPEIVQPR